MSGRIFTRVSKPASATPSRQPHAPVPKRSPWVQRQADAVQQENGPSVHGVGGAGFDFTKIPLYPPNRADIRVKPHVYCGPSNHYFMEPVPPRPVSAVMRAPQVQRQRDTEGEDKNVQAKINERPIKTNNPPIQRQAEAEEEEPIQAKLAVGKPNDKFEQEADRVADTVMRMPEPSIVQRQGINEDEREESGAIQTKPLSESVTPWVQRQTNGAEEVKAEEEEVVQAKPDIQKQAENEEQEESLQARAYTRLTSSVFPDFEAKLNRMHGQGQPLSDSTRSFFEQRFGQNFSDVRIHTDGQAAKLAGQINSQAFTRGHDIYFGAINYQPKMTAGRRLLAHELTHVVQQGHAAPLVGRGVDPNSAPEAGTPQIARSPVPDVQASFISFVLKMGAKSASKGILKNFIKTKIKAKLKKVINKKLARELAKEADQLLTVLEDPWWATAVGFIPVVGDVFDLVRVPKQIATAMKKADKLEEKVKRVLRTQRARVFAPGQKITDILKAKKGSIKDAKLPKGAPSWDQFSDMIWKQIEAGAKANEPGFKTVRKLLTDKRFDK